MKAPPNYGSRYTKSYDDLFAPLAKQYGVALVPFLLERVAGDPKFNLPDGVHPNEAGHRVMAEQVATALLPLLKSK
jgi:acyl-CoA thioesterase-1